MRQSLHLQVARWLRVILWLTPVAVLAVWVGGSALPSLAIEARIGTLCSAGAAALRTAVTGAPLLRNVRAASSAPVQTVPGMPPVPDPNNLYSEIAAGELSAQVAADPARIYVPNRRS